MAQAKHTPEKATETYTGARMLNMEFSLPDATSSAAAAVSSALEFTARKMKLNDADAAIANLREGNVDARGYFEYGLARELAEHIGAMDDEVQAVYVYNPEATPEDLAFAEFTSTLVHVVVWARRKTEALNALVAALDRAVTEQYNQALAGSRRAHVLDVQVVDDAEINSRTGFGAMLAWLHNRPLMVWKR